jgi:hypothetical protein
MQKRRDLFHRIKWFDHSNNRSNLCLWSDQVKTVERVIVKVAVIQFVLLLLTQLIFHRLDEIPQLKQITKYEGVTKNTMTKIVETMRNN